MGLGYLAGQVGGQRVQCSLHQWIVTAARSQLIQLHRKRLALSQPRHRL